MQPVVPGANLRPNMLIFRIPSNSNSLQLKGGARTIESGITKGKSMTSEILLTVTDTAKLLDLSSEHVRYLSNTGRLRVAYRLSSGVRLFLRTDIEEFAATREKRRLSAA
jgi:hypothetical protein